MRNSSILFCSMLFTPIAVTAPIAVYNGPRRAGSKATVCAHHAERAPTFSLPACSNVSSGHAAARGLSSSRLMCGWSRLSAKRSFAPFTDSSQIRPIGDLPSPGRGPPSGCRRNQARSTIGQPQPKEFGMERPNPAYPGRTSPVLASDARENTELTYTGDSAHEGPGVQHLASRVEYPA